MSAFEVSDLHINTIVNFASSRSRLNLEPEQCQTMAQTLRDQNTASLRACYGEGVETASEIRFVRHLGEFNPIAIVKLCYCYDFQACETDGYRDTEAAKFIRRVRGFAIEAVKGYEEAPWCI